MKCDINWCKNNKENECELGTPELKCTENYGKCIFCGSFKNRIIN